MKFDRAIGLQMYQIHQRMSGCNGLKSKTKFAFFVKKRMNVYVPPDRVEDSKAVVDVGAEARVNILRLVLAHSLHTIMAFIVE